MKTLEKIRTELLKAHKEICGAVDEMRIKYAGIENKEKMILEIVQGHLSRVAKMYSKKGGENENN